MNSTALQVLFGIYTLFGTTVMFYLCFTFWRTCWGNGDAQWAKKEPIRCCLFILVIHTIIVVTAALWPATLSYTIVDYEIDQAKRRLKNNGWWQQ